MKVMRPCNRVQLPPPRTESWVHRWRMVLLIVVVAVLCVIGSHYNKGYIQKKYGVDLRTMVAPTKTDRK